MWKAILVTDCDGCLTDGTVLYLDNGICGRRFSVIDGMGFQLLKENGILPLIVSGEDDQNIRDRANKLQVTFLHSKDKLETVAEYTVLSSALPSNTPLIVFGDDVNDLELMQVAEFVGCPSDAQPEIKEYVTLRYNEGSGYVCKNRGGENAFREFTEVFLAIEKRERTPLFQRGSESRH